MRILLDTNVLVSALIKGGKPYELLNAVFARNHTLILSRPLVEEFSRVSTIKRIRRYVTTADAAKFLRTLVAGGKLIRVRSRLRELNDPDDQVLRTAYDGQADFIVTGDRHLLQKGQFRGTRIVGVDEMLRILEEQD